MRILKHNGKTGVWTLDDVDIGDYLEAMFISGPNRLFTIEDINREPMWVVGYQLELTLCSDNIEPEVIEYRTIAKTAQTMFDGRAFGDQLAISSCKYTNRNYEWYVPRINGETLGMFGRGKVS